MEAPVKPDYRIRAARRTHREAPHRGRRPIVGKVFDDAVARTAMRAVDEKGSGRGGIRSESSGRQSSAGRQSRGGTYARFGTAPRQLLPGSRTRQLQRMRSRMSRQNSTVELAGGPSLIFFTRAAIRSGIALGLDHDALARIDDPACEPERGRLAMDEGPETDALHGAAHENARSHSPNRPSQHWV